jgi:hypothetical protein
MIFGLGIALAAICLRLAGERVPARHGCQSLVREEATSS